MALHTCRTYRLTILGVWALLFWTAGAVWAGSDPLTLGGVLQGVTAQPGAPASSELSALFPRRQSLYLDCDRLAFAETTAIDPARSQPLFDVLAPLVARQLDVMERFLDVLLADQRFATESEAMAVAYVQFDRAKARAELGQYSELSVLELEAVYQQFLHRRTASEIGQQHTRALLAASLGDIGELPRDLVVPTLPPIPEAVPTFDELRPKVSAAAESGSLMSGRDEIDRLFIERERDQQLFHLLLRLKLLDAAMRRVRVESLWNDLRLDRSRTLYEQEVTADLGYSMSQQTQSRFEEQRVAYCRFLAWAEIRALIGEPVWTATTEGP